MFKTDEEVNKELAEIGFPPQYKEDEAKKLLQLLAAGDLTVGIVVEIYRLTYGRDSTYLNLREIYDCLDETNWELE